LWLDPRVKGGKREISCIRGEKFRGEQLHSTATKEEQIYSGRSSAGKGGDSFESKIGEGKEFNGEHEVRSQRLHGERTMCKAGHRGAYRRFC